VARRTAPETGAGEGGAPRFQQLRNPLFRRTRGNECGSFQTSAQLKSGAPDRPGNRCRGGRGTAFPATARTPGRAKRAPSLLLRGAVPAKRINFSGPRRGPFCQFFSAPLTFPAPRGGGPAGDSIKSGNPLFRRTRGNEYGSFQTSAQLKSGAPDRPGNRCRGGRGTAFPATARTPGRAKRAPSLLLRGAVPAKRIHFFRAPERPVLPIFSRPP